MFKCEEQNCNQDFQNFNEILSKIQFAISAQDLKIQSSENRILFKKLKNLLTQNFFVFQFFNNEIISRQVFEAFKTLIMADKNFSIMKDIVKLLVLTVGQSFDSDDRINEPLASKIWFEIIYREFLENYYSKICSYLTKCRPSKYDQTFILIQFDTVIYLIKLIDFRLLVKNYFVIDQISDLKLYWKFYPDKFYKILSLTIEKFYKLNLIDQLNRIFLVELFVLIFSGYSILTKFFNSDSKFKLLCVQDLSWLFFLTNKFVNMPVEKQISMTKLKIFDLLINLLAVEIKEGNRNCPQCLDFLNQCLKSVNKFIKSNTYSLEDEYQSRYLQILEISTELIETCVVLETNSMQFLVQSSMCFEIIENLIKFKKIETKFFYHHYWPKVISLIQISRQIKKSQDFSFFVKIFLKIYTDLEEIDVLENVINLCRILLDEPNCILQLKDCLISTLRLLDKFKMEGFFREKFFILLEMYENSARKLEVKKWLQSLDLYLDILKSKSKEIYFLKLDGVWNSYFKTVVDNLINRNLEKENFELVENSINSILKLVDLIFTYFDGRIIESCYVKGILNFLETIFENYFRHISNEFDNNLTIYQKKLSLIFIIEKIKNL